MSHSNKDTTDINEEDFARFMLKMADVAEGLPVIERRILDALSSLGGSARVDGQWLRGDYPNKVTVVGLRMRDINSLVERGLISACQGPNGVRLYLPVDEVGR